MKELLYLKDVATLRLDPAKCTGCGMCLDVCPRAVLARSNGNTDLDSSGRPSLRPGTPGGSEESDSEASWKDAATTKVYT
jgi:ferredoxin